MKIALFTQVRNEAYFISKFLEHYSKFVSDIHLFDHFSTDNTLEIAENMDLGNCTLHITKEFGNPNGLDDTEKTELYNNVWKRYPADWVIVCDADEILYHPNIIEFLKECKEIGITLINTVGFQMYSLVDPNPDKSITETHKFGFPCELYSKNIIFSPQDIQEINYAPGAHTCKPQGNVRKCNIPLYLLHYKFIGGYQRIIDHYADRNDFMTDKNKQDGHGYHYAEEKEKVMEQYRDGVCRSFQIF